MSADAFVAAARGFLGAPWMHQGRSEKGLDCIGLVALSLRAIGVDAPLDASYGRLQDYRQARGYLETFCDRVGSPEVGDIVLFKTSQTLHMAIVTEVDGLHPKRVIQALGPKAKVVEIAIQFPPLMLWRPKWPS